MRNGVRVKDHNTDKARMYLGALALVAVLVTAVGTWSNHQSEPQPESSTTFIPAHSVAYRKAIVGKTSRKIPWNKVEPRIKKVHQFFTVNETDSTGINDVITRDGPRNTTENVKKVGKNISNAINHVDGDRKTTGSVLVDDPDNVNASNGFGADEDRKSASTDVTTTFQKETRATTDNPRDGANTKVTKRGSKKRNLTSILDGEEVTINKIPEPDDEKLEFPIHYWTGVTVVGMGLFVVYIMYDCYPSYRRRGNENNEDRPAEVIEVQVVQTTEM